MLYEIRQLQIKFDGKELFVVAVLGGYLSADGKVVSLMGLAKPFDAATEAGIFAEEKGYKLAE